jgi:hypothetical protein
MSGRRDAVDAVPGLAPLLSRQGGLARREQLRDLGVTRKHVEEQVAAGRWRLVAPEVVSTDNGRLDLEQLRWRAVLHAPEAWLAGRSALQRLGLSGYEPDTIHILVPRDNRPRRLPGVTIHVSDRLPEDRCDPAGLPTTTAARAAIDGAAWSAHPRLAAGLVMSVVQRRLATVSDLLDELECAGRVHHKIAVREALDHAVLGADSLAEADVVTLVRRAGLPVPRRQSRSRVCRHDLEVTLPDGLCLVIEVDGPQHELLLRIPSYAVRREADDVVARLSAINAAAELRRRQS